MYLLQAILRTASERTSVRKWLDSAASKSTNSALLRFKMYQCKLLVVSVQQLTVATPIEFNAVMREVISPVTRRHPTGSKVAVVMSLLTVRMRKCNSCFRGIIEECAYAGSYVTLTRAAIWRGVCSCALKSVVGCL